MFAPAARARSASRSTDSPAGSMKPSVTPLPPTSPVPSGNSIRSWYFSRRMCAMRSSPFSPASSKTVINPSASRYHRSEARELRTASRGNNVMGYISMAQVSGDCVYKFRPAPQRGSGPIRRLFLMRTLGLGVRLQFLGLNISRRRLLAHGLAQHRFHADLFACVFRLLRRGLVTGAVAFGRGSRRLRRRNFSHLLVGRRLHALDYRIGNLGGKQPNGTQCVIVARNHVIHFAGISVGVHHRDHGNSQLARLAHRDLLLVGVNDEDRVREAGHVFDPRQVRLQVLALPLQLDHFLLGQQLVAAVGGHVVEFFEPLHRFLHGHPVGEQAAEPAVVHVKHAGAPRLFGNRVLRLALGAHEEQDLALGRQVLHELGGFLEHLQRLLQVNDVNTVALSEDVLLHLGIPALGLVPEVDARFEQFLHGDGSQSTSFVGLHPGRSRDYIPVPPTACWRSEKNLAFPLPSHPSRAMLVRRATAMLKKFGFDRKAELDEVSARPNSKSQALSLAELEPLPRAHLHPSKSKSGACRGPRRKYAYNASLIAC